MTEVTVQDVKYIVVSNDGSNTKHVTVSSVVFPAQNHTYNENKLGSDCSGLSGEQGRVLTLSNTTLTVPDVTMVFRNGAMLMPTDLTIVDNASASTITFTTVEIFDDDIIRVIYFVY